MEKGTKFIWPLSANRVWYAVRPDIIREGSIKGGKCYDKWHNGKEYVFIGHKTLFGEEYVLFNDTENYDEYSGWWVRKKDFEEIFPNIKTNNMDFTKKGTKFKLGTQEITIRVMGWSSPTPSDIGTSPGNWKTFGTQIFGGKTWVLYEKDDYPGARYWMTPIEELNLIFNKTQKTMKKITAVKAKNFPVSELKTGMEFSSKEIGKGQIILQGSGVFIVHNNSMYEGGCPRPMPKGYKYSWFLCSTDNEKIDLTYDNKFTNIQLGGETTEKTAFKNSFVVKGTPALIKAFKEEAIAAGWKFEGAATSTMYKSLYFCAQGDNVHLGAHFRLDGEAACAKKFSLLTQWDLAVKAMEKKEVVKEKLEYIKFNVTGQEADGLVKGRVYKITKIGGAYAYKVIGEYGNIFGVDEGEYVTGTKAEFDSQKVYVGYIGGYKVNIKAIKISGYESMKVACIGCKESQQVYTVGALETLRDVMNSKDLEKAKNRGEGVEFTIQQVEALIEQLEE